MFCVPAFSLFHKCADGYDARVHLVLMLLFHPDCLTKCFLSFLMIVLLA
jgi:hypothetical protein